MPDMTTSFKCARHIHKLVASFKSLSNWLSFYLKLGKLGKLSQLGKLKRRKL